VFTGRSGDDLRRQRFELRESLIHARAKGRII
jgi:hypothetical protein